MARVSRREKKERILDAGCFRAGIYARLSVNGGERKNESVDTQIAIAKQYIREHPEIEFFGCYVDIGSTGTNFKREGFERLMQDVCKKRINCVIVKDLSRFGRNHIEAGRYIQNIFPLMGVRFVAVTDGVDTLEQTSGADEMAIGLTNLVNEMYARDIARKVGSSKRCSQEQGGYTGGFAPYGYFADWTDGKRCLFICPETADIVREIYESFVAGSSRRQIVEALYERGVHRPCDYRETGHVYCQQGEPLTRWSSGTLKRMLMNPVYTGCLAHGVSCGKLYKNRNRHGADDSDRMIRYNAHKPVVSEAVFLQAVSLLSQSSGKRRHEKDYVEQSPCSDQWFCIESGYPMHNAEQHLQRELDQCERRYRNAKKRESAMYVRYHTGLLSPEEFRSHKKESEKLLQGIREKEARLRMRLNAQRAEGGGESE